MAGNRPSLIREVGIKQRIHGMRTTLNFCFGEESFVPVQTESTKRLMSEQKQNCTY